MESNDIRRVYTVTLENGKKETFLSMETASEFLKDMEGKGHKANSTIKASMTKMAHGIDKCFAITFQLSKMKMFNVNYYYCGNNSTPYFSTSADAFRRGRKSDFDQFGQAQDDITKGYPKARAFWKKWDLHHTHQLTEKQYKEMRKDLKALKETYNFLYKDGKRDPHISFDEEVELSKMKPKK